MTKAEKQSRPWLGRYDHGVPQSIAYDPTPFPHLLEQTIKAFPQRTALYYQGFRLSYGRMGRMIDAFAAALRGFCVQKGDRVAILLPNVIPCVVAYHAILKIGAVVVMNNPLYTDRELEHQFNDSGAICLITLDLLANRMIDLRPKTGIRQIVYTGLGDYLPLPKRLLFPLVARKKGLAAEVRTARDIYKWRDLVDASEPATAAASLSSDDLAMLQYTGGTTGVSKGVMLTHGNLSRQLQQISAWFPGFKKGSDEVTMGALPFFHVMGLNTSMNFALYQGWGNILVPKPQPDALIQALRKGKPSFVSLVPTMYIGILGHPLIDKTDLSCIKGCFSGSAPLPKEVITEFNQRTGAFISEGFGLTESCPVTHMNPFDGQRKIGSIGMPLPDTDCRIVDLANGDQDVLPGQPGELVVKGPQVMAGYWNKPEETAQTLKDGWLYTGDIATMDEEGYFYIVDRKKDMILSGGYNVYPREIDEVLYTHPKVMEACAIGVPHPTRGEQIKVFVVTKPGQTATQEELIEYCRERLAKYKLPTIVAFTEALPKTSVGKILRKELRNQEKATCR
jgi:long-chain acyl-CoA synthetase